MPIGAIEIFKNNHPIFLKILIFQKNPHIDLKLNMKIEELT